MGWENISFVELSFINSPRVIEEHLVRTAIFSSLQKKHSLVPLSEYLEGTQYGYNSSAKSSGNVRFLRITDIKEGDILWDSVPFCNCKEKEKYVLGTNDIVVARTGGTTGKSTLIKELPEETIFAGYLIRLRLKQNVDPEFIYGFLNSYAYWSQVVELKRGAAQPNVNARRLESILIPKCIFEEQIEYVKAFGKGIEIDGVSDKVDLVSRMYQDINKAENEQSHQLTLLKKLRQQILQDAVMGKLVEQDPDDESASVLLEKIAEEKQKLIAEGKIKKGKPLPEITEEDRPFEIPTSWEWCRFNELGVITGGGTPSKANESFWNGNIPWVTPKDMGAKFNSDSEQKVTQKGVDSSSAKIIPQGSVIIVGRSGILKRKLPVSINLIECTVNQDMKVLIPYFMDMNLYIQLSLNGLENHILQYYVKYGMTVHSLIYNDFAQMPLPLPPLNEQHRIVTKVEQLMKICDDLEQSIQQNQKYTQDLLQVALKEALQ